MNPFENGELADKYSKSGTKVLYTGQGGSDIDREVANKHLTIGTLYTISSTVHDLLQTNFILLESPDASFNAVMFNKTPQWTAEQSLLKFFNKGEVGETLVYITDKNKILKMLNYHASVSVEKHQERIWMLEDILRKMTEEFSKPDYDLTCDHPVGICSCPQLVLLNSAERLLNMKL